MPQLNFRSVDGLLKRRDFLLRLAQGATALGLILLARCGLGGDDASDRSFKTSTESNHSHTVTVKGILLSAPPSAGKLLSTSEVDNHTHDVDLSQAQLFKIAAYQNFTITTSNENGHEHTVIFN